MPNPFVDSAQKPSFSGHETFPLRQLWLLKAYREVDKFSPKTAPLSVFSGEDAIVRFGAGKNMVSSIRHWALSTGMIEYAENQDGFSATPTGDMLLSEYGLDPFGDSASTAWLIHWRLAGQGGKNFKSATWYWLFNHVTSPSFTRNDLNQAYATFLKDIEIKASPATLKRDIECCIKSYVPKADSKSMEEISEPVLAELGIIQSSGNDSFEFRRGPKHTLTDHMFTLALNEFWNWHSPGTSTLSFEAIAHEYGSPGRVFKLDESSISERLSNIEQISGGMILWSDTAGMKQITRNRQPELDGIDSSRPPLFLKESYV
jgi:hypothetical protein